MKKSQSIFLLSGLVPLVAAPIAIVASCSSDTATTTTFSLKGTDITLNNLTDQEKDLNKYTGDSKDPLVNLILAKKDQIFNNPPADLKNTQIEIPGAVTADATAGSLTFEFKVKSPTENTADLINLTKVVLKGFASTPAETPFKIKFKDQVSNLPGDATKVVSDQSINEAWVISEVVKKRADIFEATTGSLPAEEKWWNDNLEVVAGSLNKNEQDRSLTVDVKVKKAHNISGDNSPIEITKTLTFENFKQ